MPTGTLRVLKGRRGVKLVAALGAFNLLMPAGTLRMLKGRRGIKLAAALGSCTDPAPAGTLCACVKRMGGAVPTSCSFRCA
eukprot:scaffold58657_cov23-Tisochrysis_lutea.AAC.3